MYYEYFVPTSKKLKQSCARLVSGNSSCKVTKMQQTTVDTFPFFNVSRRVPKACHPATQLPNRARGVRRYSCRKREGRTGPLRIRRRSRKWRERDCWWCWDSTVRCPRCASSPQLYSSSHPVSTLLHFLYVTSTCILHFLWIHCKKARPIQSTIMEISRDHDHQSRPLNIQTLMRLFSWTYASKFWEWDLKKIMVL